MSTRRSTRSLIFPAVWLGCAPGLVAMSVLFKLGMPAGLAALCGLPAGIAAAMLLLKKI
ncbi:hypothetical protein [Roseateles asaccharophilus]|uniref:Uncharacterized protein n=1 Tax=Roseateles asaccharophilus TaxID=582607 RepID=A0ABU2A458_9BURK|nr:hypothetical protein [Roseateles asaccharophilus]MDR7331984.1 hypothetical protein [Roseateles asaccharophilus]